MTYKPDVQMYIGIIPESRWPRVWSPFYVVYKYAWAKNTYIVGCETDEAAAKLQQDLLTHKDIIRCEMFGHYPLDVMKEMHESK